MTSEPARSLGEPAHSLGDPAALDPLGPYGHVVPRAAATVVLLRPGRDGPEVLLTRRPQTMAFAPGLHAFPGGSVDATDTDPAILARLDDQSAGPAHVAAIRELFEEAGVLIAETRASAKAVTAARAALVAGEADFSGIAEALDLRLRASLLVPLSRWVTPPILPRRFDARFFAADLPDGAEATFIGDEVAGHRWITPREALDGLADGSVPMWMPTSTTLQRLVHVGSLDVDGAVIRPGPAGLPEVAEVAPDVLRVSQPGGAGVDGLLVHAYLVGGRELLAIDAGDPSEEALLAIAEAATGTGATIGAIAVTAGDPDHAGGCEHLREGLSVIVYGGVGAGHELPFEVVEVGDGGAVPSGDVRAVAIAAPGPRPDHTLYWLPASRTAIVGDLVGPPPSHSIPGPPDRPAWRRSLARLEDLAPERLLPAHGDPIEGRIEVGEAIAQARLQAT